jgi:hypothetical protein
VGGTRTNVIPYTFTEDGPHTIVISATSGRPGCGNPYADSIEDDRTPVDVDPAG